MDFRHKKICGFFSFIPIAINSTFQIPNQKGAEIPLFPADVLCYKALEINHYYFAHAPK